QPEQHRHAVHAGHEEGEVVGPLRHRHRAPEQVAEGQRDHDGEHDPEHHGHRLGGPVQQVPAGHGPAVGQRPAQPCQRSVRYLRGERRHPSSLLVLVRLRNTSSRVGLRTATSSASTPAPVRAGSTAARAATRSVTGTLTRRVSGSAAAGPPAAAATIPAASPSRSGSRITTSSRSPPSRDFSSSGVPPATTRPASITTTRPASWSASSRYCVVSSTVVPPATSPRTACQTSPRLRGSSPVV